MRYDIVFLFISLVIKFTLIFNDFLTLHIVKNLFLLSIYHRCLIDFGDLDIDYDESLSFFFTYVENV